MPTVPTIPMLAPDGTSGEIPQDRVQDALQSGFKPAVEMASPDGKLGYVPQERVADAQNAGFKVNPYRGTQLPTGTVTAQPDQSLADKASQWAQNVQSDLKNGTDLTGVGSVLKAMGAHGLDSGNSQAVGDFMGSLPLGVAKMVQAGGEAGQGQIKQGAKDAIGGALQASTIPASFVAPEAGDATDAVMSGAGKVGDAIASKISPTAMKAQAAGLLQSVAHDANQVPVQLDNAGDAAMRLMDWQGKTQLGPTVNKFLNRITNPKAGPLTYEDARDFYQLLGRMSVNETTKLAPAVQRDLTQMVVGLKQDIGNAADTVGRASDYYQGLGDYATASKYQDMLNDAKDFMSKQVIQGIAKGVGAGAGGTAAYGLWKWLKGQ